jgi:RHS repeat-associated protein
MKTLKIRGACSPIAVLLLTVLPLLGEDGTWSEVPETRHYDTVGRCYYEKWTEVNSVTMEEREKSKTISCQDDCEDKGDKKSAGGAPSMPMFDSMSFGGGCTTCGSDSSSFSTPTWVPDPEAALRYDPWGDLQPAEAWMSDPVASALTFAPRLSLGESSYGTRMGYLAVTPDLIYAQPGDPLGVADVQAVLPTSLGTMETQVASGWRLDLVYYTLLPTQQYATQDTVFELRQQLDGGLMILAFRRAETQVVTSDTLIQVPADSAAITELKMTREWLENYPAFRLKGSYLGKPYEACMGAIQTVSGSASLREENGVRSEIIDTSVVDSSDIDGFGRLRSTRQFRRDPTSGIWVLTSERFVKSRTLINGQEVAVEDEVVTTDVTPLITTYSYDELEFVNNHLNKSFGRLASQTNPDGSWVRYQYDEEGRLWRTMRPWLNAPATAAEATPSNCQMETILYTPQVGILVQAERSVETHILGILMTSKSTICTGLNFGSDDGLRVTDVVTHHRLNSSGNVVAYDETSSKDYLVLPDHQTRLVMSAAASGTKTAYHEESGTLAVNGSFTPSVNGLHQARYTWSHLTSQALAESGHSIKTTQYVDAVGLVMRELKAVAVTNGAYASVTYAVYDGIRFVYDAKGRLSQTLRLDGTLEHSYTSEPIMENDVLIGHNDIHIDGQGTRTETRRTPQGEIISTKQPAKSASAFSPYPNSTLMTAMVDGRLEKSTISAHETLAGVVMLTQSISNDIAAPQLTARWVDAAGRTVSTLENGSVTEHSYPEHGRVHVITAPGSQTRIVRNFRDGQMQSVTGNSVVAEHHQFTVNADGSITETTHSGAENSARWRSVMRDYAGTVLKEISPNPENPTQTITVAYYHDDAGRLVKVQRPGMADELTTFRTNGEVYQRGLDLNQNGTLNITSSDTLTEMDSYVEIDGQGKGWQVATQRVLTEAVGLPYTTALSRTTRRSLGTGSAITLIVTEPDGTTATTTTQPQRSLGFTTVSYNSGSESNPLTVLETQIRGLSVVRKDLVQGRVTMQSYDKFRHLKSRLHRSGLPGSDLETYHYTATGELYSHARNGMSMQSLLHYPPTHAHAGKTQRITDAFSGGITDIDYNELGLEATRSGTGTYRQERGYTAWGEQETLKTWRAVGGTADVTTWAYQPATGLLISKTDAANQATLYTNDQAGRVKTRTNARGIVTTYSYDNAGRLTGIDYSDNTPDVTLQLDRAGRIVQATDATGTRIVSYAEALPGGQESRVTWAAGSLLPQWDFLRTSANHRRDGWLVAQRGVAQSQVQETYWAERLARVEFAEVISRSVEFNLGHRWSTEAAEDSVGYSGSQFWLSSFHLPPYSENDAVSVVSPLTQLNWRAGTSPYDEDQQPFMKLEFMRYGGYGPMAQSQKIRSANGLSAITETEDAHNVETNYRYNARGEVRDTTQISGTWGLASRLQPGGVQRYNYDGIGNRSTASQSKLGTTLSQANSSTEARQSDTYTPNALNQYDTITRENPLLRLVQGEARTDTSLTVSLLNGTSTQALTVARVVAGEKPFVAEASVDVSAGPQWRKLRVQGTRSGVGPNGSALTATREGWMFFPPQSESLTYDLDGNLTADARWTYVWDAENRLIAMEEKTIASNGPARKRLEFTYDHLSRRVRKLVRSAEGIAANVVSTNWPVTKDRRFIYDGWNMIAEIDASLTNGTLALFRSYAWGNDLSGTPQGAGGVGGLLMIQERDLRRRNQSLQVTPPAIYAPCYDLNGNILSYIEINRGEGLTHSFEYDAFGKELTSDTLVPTGNSAAKENLPFRFSTKYHDDETGLAYYGYRYYRADLGRWLNRDPIEEKGGLNLYGMVANDAVNRVDILGLEFSGNYDISEGSLTLSDQTRTVKNGLFRPRKPATCACAASSGDNDPKHQSQSGTGPIPEGSYSVYVMGNRIAGSATFLLDPQDGDGNTGNDQWDGGTERTFFRIHAADLTQPRNGSNGCIVLEPIPLQELVSFIDQTEPGPSVIITQDPRHSNAESFTLVRVGSLSVTR